ncbi:lysophosphatidylcholine acyltransferase 1-like [Tropilaelaps mercedesae]|uniref:Lysophosphatidylcholine acyltransferase 1-like n=1 Tax=Tropilaelaps mercedesae TaxID=418985 RepID=A0A1V9XME1_9ACAR|nr:lysophosphatidylcholine acyltransferase 1-like [Tropilaelaps mercedesae]
MVKSRDISVSLTKGDISPEPQPHLNDSDNDQEHQRPQPHESIRQDDAKTGSNLAAADVKEHQQISRHLQAAEPSTKSSFGDGAEYVPPKIPNPFFFRVHLTATDKIKVALMTVLVFPVRVLLVSLFLFLTWLGCFVGLLGYSEQELESKPIQGWRRQVPSQAGFIDFLIFRIELMFIWGGLVWEFKGQKATRSQAPLLVCGPHQSFLDGVIVLLSGGQAPCTKIESKSIPLLGTILRFIQPVFVKRSSKESRQTTLSEIKNRATSQEPWSQIVIFPEGTCSNGSVLLKFKQGAFSAGVPVQPVLIRYPNKLNTLTWTWDGPSALKTMWLTACQWQTRMVIEYLPVYRPSEAERCDPGLFAHNVRRLMATALGVGTTELGYDDLRYLVTGDSRQPHHTLAIVKLLKFRAKNGLTPEQLPLDIEKVSSLVAEAETAGLPTRLARSELLTALGVGPSEVAKEFLDVLEMEDDVYQIGVHHDVNNLDKEETQEEQVDLRVLLAALHLANRDGDSAFKCLSGNSVVTPVAPATSALSITTNGIDEETHNDSRYCHADDDNAEPTRPALTQSAFCRLCWLAMQMSAREAVQLFEHFRPSPPTLFEFREFVSRNTDRCKGIAYFDDARRIELGPEAQHRTEGSANQREDGLATERKSTLIKNAAVQKMDSNGSAGNKDPHKTMHISQIKRQKAE